MKTPLNITLPVVRLPRLDLPAIEIDAARLRHLQAVAAKMLPRCDDTREAYLAPPDVGLIPTQKKGVDHTTL
jgi:hypothetical protein